MIRWLSSISSRKQRAKQNSVHLQNNIDSDKQKLITHLLQQHTGSKAGRFVWRGKWWELDAMLLKQLAEYVILLAQVLTLLPQRVQLSYYIL